jgi:cytochrome c-type biogenesis protein CcmH/NrfG|uniref:tetratricopeptide repeat protein n=1 Tax=Prosthecobacter sp. TaxID=1965333 RepID=UPI00378501AA
MSKRHRKTSKPQSVAQTMAVMTAPSEADKEPDLPAAPATWKTSGWTHAAIVAVLLSLCTGMYAWTKDFPLVFDDYTYLIDNPIFQDPNKFSYLSNFEEFANRPARMGSDPDYAVNFILRPVAYASFALNHALDGFNPRWYRVFNIIIHALNSVLVYALLHTLLSRFASTLRSGSAVFISASAALLFAAHPLAIESVTYVIQRFTSLAAFFSLLCLWLWFVSLSAGSRAAVWALRGGAVLALLLAMQTKECSFAVPFMAVLIDWLVLRSRLRSALFRSLPLLLCAPLIPVLVILTATAQNGGSFDWGASVNIVNSRDSAINHWHYILTQFTVLAHYLRLMFWPFGLNLDPQWPKYESLWQGPVLMSLGVLLGLVAASGWLYRRFRGDVRLAMGFVFTLWYFVTIAASSGLVPLPDMMAEHRSYLPSVGIFVLVCCLLDCLRGVLPARAVWLRHAVPVALVLIATTLLAWRTVDRNTLWSTAEILWKDTVAKSPGKFRTWGNLGAAYSNNGKDDKAVECYRAALKIEPRFQNGILNLSNSLLRLNRPKESLDTTLQLIQMDNTAATKPTVAFTLGLGFAGVGRYDEAVGVFREILKAMPNDPQTHKALGLVYYQSGLPHRALDHYQKAARVQPSDQHLTTLIQAAEAAMAQKRGARMMSY